MRVQPISLSFERKTEAAGHELLNEREMAMNY